MLRSFKLRFRRRLRRSQRQLGEVAEGSGDSFERNFIQRFHKFPKVWRFMAGWLGLMLLLIGCLIAQISSLGGYYQSLKPVPGGIYTEGIVGSFTNANPIYAVNEVDRTVSRLIFPGLFTYDDHNQLVGDLAQSWSVDPTGTVYTVKLRPNLTWQDGKPLTAADVVFTYDVIENPDARSPLQSSWAGINVSAKDDRTVVFKLPNPLSSFIYGMTNGIVPQHLLGSVPMVGMRSVAFNTDSPVGSGPFAWQNIEVTGSDPQHAEETIGLIPFDDYARGAPKLKSFVVHAYADPAAMIKAYQKHQLTAMAGLDTVPATLKPADYIENDVSLTAATMTFFKTTAGVLADAHVRQGLVAAADPAEVIDRLGYPAKPVREPLLVGQLGYAARYAQKTGDPKTAAADFKQAGWSLVKKGLFSTLYKGGKPLQFTLTYADTPEYQTVAQTLQSQWRSVGVDMKLRALNEDQFQSALSQHDYDAVLYGIAIGVDPDVFVYWDSSQADIRSTNRLNLSEYNSGVADDSLEAGRTRTEPKLRVIKYQAFLQAWQTDAPALGLYQPRYLYLSRVPVYGLDAKQVNAPVDRLDNVQDWMIRTARTTDN